MKFKVLDIKQKGDNLQVAVSHEHEEREVFGIPIELYEDDKFLEEIQRILDERYNKKEISLDVSKYQGNEYGE